MKTNQKISLLYEEVYEQNTTEKKAEQIESPIWEKTLNAAKAKFEDTEMTSNDRRSHPTGYVVIDRPNNYHDNVRNSNTTERLNDIYSKVKAEFDFYFVYKEGNIVLKEGGAWSPSAVHYEKYLNLCKKAVEQKAKSLKIKLDVKK